MNNDDALYLLGIEAAADASVVRQAYDRRRLEFEQRLSNATSDGLKHKFHTTLSDLDQAYQLLVGSESPTDPTLRREQKSSMRGANSSMLNLGASTGGTLMRSESDLGAATGGLAIGHVLADRYEIRRILGQGGMGAVYEAFDQLKQESVAIKVLLPQYLGNEQGRDRFMHEAKMACKLSHPNIVKVFDVGRAEPYHFITMELLEGETLREQMEAHKSAGEPYSVAQVLNCARQLVEALEYAHKQIVHRDLKPENVWVCTDGTLKLIDFGIARAFTKSALTRTGMVMGTAYYMAPEQFNGARDVDWRADQYSLAVILYELLTGRIPQGTFSATSELRKDVPMGLSGALMKALAPDPAVRFDSLANFLAALSNRDPVTRFNRKTAVAGAIAAVTVLAIGGLWASGVFTHASPSIATAPNGVLDSPDVAATALEGETLSLLKRLQDKEQELADNVTQQQARYDAAANATQRAREGRELQLRGEIQQEAQASVFSEQQWSTRSGQVHAGQALLRAGDLKPATTQLTVARDALLGDAKRTDDIDHFVRARADYFDARQPWLDYSLKHAGKGPSNPAIHAAEKDIQAAIDRGEYAALATEVFPRLAELYTEELRLSQRRDASAPVSAPVSAPAPARAEKTDNNVPKSNSQPAATVKSATHQPEVIPAPAPAPAPPPTKREIKAERARVAAERKQAELLEKCARARHRPHGCPKPSADE